MDRFLSLLGRCDVALAVHQNKPGLDDAVAATLEIESMVAEKGHPPWAHTNAIALATAQAIANLRIT